MRVITVSREYGAGGGEVGRRLAAALGWELLDRELLHQAAELEHLPDTDLEQLDEKAVSTADRFRLHPPHLQYIHGLSEAARRAAARGNVVLVGRGTRQLLADTPDAVHLRLVAPRSWRARRIMALEGLSLDEATARCLDQDRSRDRFTRYFFGPTAYQLDQYDLIVNTSRILLDDLIAAVMALIRNDWSSSGGGVGAAGRRVLTLAREMGTGESGFGPTLAGRLDLSLYDRDLLEQEAVRLGVSRAELARIDEQPAGIFQRFRPGSLHQRYFVTLGQLMSELAAQGDVLIVGRGGSRFLRDDPRAFHVRLVAPLAVRVRRTMEYRWLAEAPARALIAETDAQRDRFYADFFGADRSDPLEYCITVNGGRLGAAAVDLVAFAAERFWARPESAATPPPNPACPLHPGDS